MKTATTEKPQKKHIHTQHHEKSHTHMYTAKGKLEV